MAEELLGVECVNGHPNPPDAYDCATCAGALAAAPHMLDNPPRMVVEASTGARLALRRDLVVGRAPQYLSYNAHGSLPGPPGFPLARVTAGGGLAG